MRRKKQVRKTKPEPIQKNSEIVTGTEFERTPWEDLDFSLDMKGFGPEIERPIFLAVGLAIATNIAGDVLAVADTRNNTTYKIASLLDLHEHITTNRLDIDIEETTGYFFYSESDFDCLLRLLPFDQAEDLAINRKITIPELQIWYSPNSKLTLKSKGATIRIYALQNILPSYSLEEAIVKYERFLQYFPPGLQCEFLDLLPERVIAVFFTVICFLLGHLTLLVLGCPSLTRVLLTGGTLKKSPLKNSGERANEHRKTSVWTIQGGRRLPTRVHLNTDVCVCHITP